VITREHGTQVEAGDESLVLRCATLAEREAWVADIQACIASLHAEALRPAARAAACAAAQDRQHGGHVSRPRGGRRAWFGFGFGFGFG